MTDEANIDEAELALARFLAHVKYENGDYVLHDWPVPQSLHDAKTLARAIFAAGYRKRSDVLEEAEAAIESVVECCTAYVTNSVMPRLDVQYAPKRDYYEAISSLKDKP